jgi:hypothetical protein
MPQNHLAQTLQTLTISEDFNDALATNLRTARTPPTPRGSVPSRHHPHHQPRPRRSLPLQNLPLQNLSVSYMI